MNLHRQAAADRTARIRQLNDAFRKTFTGGKVVMTAGVAELPDMVRANTLLELTRFDNFTADNDPHGEHDFGSFNLVGRTFFWKIDAYDPTMEFGSTTHTTGGYRRAESAEDARLPTLKSGARPSRRQPESDPFGEGRAPR